MKTTVTGVEMFKKILDRGEVSNWFLVLFRLSINFVLVFRYRPVCIFSQAGDNVGLLLRGLKREDVQRGQVSGII